ncbi:MAG: uncharacterized protein H6Q52_1442 [Deltaproteobacteria bacterium]|nr:uncharacterized protein [Deltaproteobacteria bacterium]
MVTNLDKKQIDLMRESLCVYEKARECKSLLRQQKLFFENIENFVDDRGKSCLFRLKEMCHDLFRNSTEASYKEKLFDITVGYTFHGAMKLRENLYLLQYYQPQSEIALHNLSPQERKIVNEIGVLVRKAQARLKEEFKEVATLSDELIAQLKDLIVLYKENYLLSRFLYENEKVLVKTYGRKGFDEILSMAYADGRKCLMLKTATSYLDSEYYETARGLFKRIIRKDSSNKEALFLCLYASANYFYFKNMFTRALSLAERANAMKIDENVKARYREPLKRLITDLTHEMKKKRS